MDLKNFKNKQLGWVSIKVEQKLKLNLQLLNKIQAGQRASIKSEENSLSKKSKKKDKNKEALRNNQGADQLENRRKRRKRRKRSKRKIKNIKDKDLDQKKGLNKNKEIDHLREEQEIDLSHMKEVEESIEDRDKDRDKREVVEIGQTRDSTNTKSIETTKSDTE